MKKNERIPPVHPGEILLEEFLKPMGLSQNRLALEIKVPPLRDRISDVPLLVRYYLNIYKKKYSKPELKIDTHTLNDLKGYPWPGNIREMRHAVERAIIMSTSNILTIKDFLLAAV